MMRSLTIDISSIIPYLVNGKITGIGRTTFQLIIALAKASHSLNFKTVLYSQNMKGISGKGLPTPFTAKHLYLPNRPNVNKILKYIPIKEMLTRSDLLHVPHNFAYVFNSEKTIFTLHDALFMYLNEPDFNHLEMRRKVPPLMRRCKGIVTCSESSKRDIINTMDVDPSKIDVIYWGIDQETFHKLNDKNYLNDCLINYFRIGRPYFLSVSCNSGRKNTPKLVEAYIKMSETGITNDLVLLWNNPPSFILQMISEARLNSRVHFFSNVSDHELALLYNGATAMFFPSSYEGFGLPVLEAMACGTPVVTCCNSSLPEVGGDAVIYMDEPTTDNILHYMLLLETGNLNLDDMSIKGLKQAAKFRWEKTADDYIKVYRKYLKITD